MLLAHRLWQTGLIYVLAVGMATSGAAQGYSGARPDPAGFAASMDAAMARMDRDMMAPPSGDPDQDFARMMIPHHQGAIDMAEAELRFGHDPVLRRLAQGIIVEQQQEIVVMRQSLIASPEARARVGAPPKTITKELKK